MTSARGSWRMVQLAGDCPRVGWADARTLSSRRIGSTRRRSGLTPVKHIASHTNRGSRWDTVERVCLLYRGWLRGRAFSIASRGRRRREHMTDFRFRREKRSGRSEDRRNGGTRLSRIARESTVDQEIERKFEIIVSPQYTN